MAVYDGFKALSVQGHSYKKFSFDDQCSLNEIFCSYGLEKTSMDSNEDVTAHYEEIMFININCIPACHKFDKSFPRRFLIEVKQQIARDEYRTVN